MDQYSAMSVEKLLKKWIKKANLTQIELAKRLKISQSLLSRQILGKEKMPIDRISEIITITDPPAEEIANIYRMLGEDYSNNRCFSELHDSINRIGPDKDLNSLLMVWENISEQNKATIIKIIQETEDSISARGEILLKDKIPQEIRDIFRILNDKSIPPEIPQLYFALIDYINGNLNRVPKTEIDKKILEKEKKIIEDFGGIDNVLKIFGLKPLNPSKPE